MNPNERNRTLEYSKNILRGLRLLKTLETKYDLSKLDQRLYGLASENASMDSAVGRGLLTGVFYWTDVFLLGGAGSTAILGIGALLTIAEANEGSYNPLKDTLPAHLRTRL